MAATTVTDAKEAILAAVRARPALATVSVEHGGPTENTDLSEEMIYFGAARGTGEWRTLGANRRHESYTVELRIVVLKFGDDEAATEKRAFVLFDEVQSALTDDRFLGGLLYSPAEVESWEQTNTPTPEQWGALIVAQIRCEAMFAP